MEFSFVLTARHKQRERLGQLLELFPEEIGQGGLDEAGLAAFLDRCAAINPTDGRAAGEEFIRTIDEDWGRGVSRQGSPLYIPEEMLVEVAFLTGSSGDELFVEFVDFLYCLDPSLEIEAVGDYGDEPYGYRCWIENGEACVEEGIFASPPTEEEAQERVPNYR
ncbi:hypothetical protein [Chitinimonas lacunae]|uniref:Uncharacterized protein n=1 Tax=Chitinimonas lacunae TaxID=1963018 RepID=A0ABV8MTI2_9NEIS